jgi:stage V sporulation protein B
MDHSSALAAYGVVQSMALPVLLFPCALLWSFAGLLVPEVTESHVQKDMTRIRFMMQRVFSLTLFFAIGTSGIMIAFSDILGSILYQNTEVSHIIRLLSPLIPIMYIDSATDAMLKGLGQQVYCMKVNIVDSLLSVVFVLILIPRMGIYGYILTIYITELMNASLSIVRLLDIGKLKPPVISWVIKPLLCIIGATCVGRLLYTAFPGTWMKSNRAENLIVLLFVVICLYALLLFFTRAIKKTELVWLSSFFKKEKNSHVTQ